LKDLWFYFENRAIKTSSDNLKTPSLGQDSSSFSQRTRFGREETSGDNDFLGSGSQRAARDEVRGTSLHRKICQSSHPTVAPSE
jgi:hypothetical protein